MTSAIGFNGIFQLRRWTPVSVVVENMGVPVSGAVEIIVTSGSEYKGDVHETVYSMDLELPAGSKKVFSFTVLIDSFSHPLVIRLRQKEYVFQSETINLRHHYTDKTLLLVVGEKNLTDLVLMLPKDVQPISSGTDYLPEVSHGFDGVHMVILPADDIQKLREKQFTALHEWIKDGGHVVISGGINYGTFTDSRTQRLLPIRIFGFKQTEKLFSLERFCGHTLVSETPFLILHADISGSETILREGAFPLIIRKSVEQGNLIFLAFDFQERPFINWQGGASFWQKLAVVGERIPENHTVFDKNRLASLMLTAFPGGFPEIIPVILFLGVYLVTIKFFFNRIRRYSFWKIKALFIAVSLLFSVAGFMGYYQFQLKNRLTQNRFSHIQKVSRSTLCRFQHLIGLYTLSDRNFRFDLGDTPSRVYHVKTSATHSRDRDRIQIQESEKGWEIVFFMKKWSHHFIKMESTLTFDINGEVTINDSGVSIQIENKTPHTISGCRVIVGGRIWSIGDISAHKKQEWRIGKSDIETLIRISDIDFYEFEFDRDIDTENTLYQKLQREIEKRVLSAHLDINRSNTETMHLSGWILSEPVLSDFDPPAGSKENAAFFEWSIPVSKN